jgi:hypothetical protein
MTAFPLPHDEHLKRREESAAAKGERHSPLPLGEVVQSPGEGLRPREIGGRDGPEPTRFGDWEKAGRCIDF